MVYHLTGDETRLGIIEVQQSLGRQTFAEGRVGSEVFREPKAEKFLLSGTFNIARDADITKNHVAGYKSAPEHVRNVLLAALHDFQVERDYLPLRKEREFLGQRGGDSCCLRKGLGPYRL